MLRAYRRCDEKRTARLEILWGFIEMSVETMKSIATLHQPPNLEKKDEINAVMAFKEDFPQPETATA